MGIALTLKRFLKEHAVDYEVIEHRYSEGAWNTAKAARIPGQQLLKGVVFMDEDFYFTMAILPASYRVRRHTLNQIFDRHLQLASEEELEELFPDCEPGAIPCLGMAYGINTIWEDDIEAYDEYWLEAGDHRHLIRLSRADLQRLLQQSLHEHIGIRTRSEQDFQA